MLQHLFHVSYCTTCIPVLQQGIERDFVTVFPIAELSKTLAVCVGFVRVTMDRPADNNHHVNEPPRM